MNKHVKYKFSWFATDKTTGLFSETSVFSSHRSHVAFFKCPSSGGVNESPSYGPDSQTVAPVLSASEMLVEETTPGRKQTV